MKQIIKKSNYDKFVLFRWFNFRFGYLPIFALNKQFLLEQFGLAPINKQTGIIQSDFSNVTARNEQLICSAFIGNSIAFMRIFFTYLDYQKGEQYTGLFSRVPLFIPAANCGINTTFLWQKET